MSRIVKMEVYPVAGKDCMELNLSGAHAPYFTRNIVVLYDENGETYKEHTRDSYRNFWIVNSETKELIPRSIFNKESEEEYIIWNERYLDMLRLYPEESE